MITNIKEGVMMTIQDIVMQHQLSHLFIKGTFGLERESLRVHVNGQLALTDHPHVLGDRAYHQTISTDFSESQPELITSVSDSVHQMYRKMQALEKIFFLSMEEDEYIWTYSMPAILPEEDLIPIIRVKDQEQIEYRQGLAEVYGKRKQMISGMHFNFGFSDEFLMALADSDHSKTKTEWSNDLHMELARNFIRYRWVLTYLFGACPEAHPSFYDHVEDQVDEHVRSIRSSPLGYHNALPRQVSYESVEDYCHDILTMVEEGELSQEREFYGSARPRGAESLVEMAEQGVRYVELRSIDNNPYAVTGLTEDQLDFTHLFCLLMVWMEIDHQDTQALEIGTVMNENTALEKAGSSSQYQEEGIDLMEKMAQMVDDLGMADHYHQLVKQAHEAFLHPERTLSARVSEDLKQAGSLIDFGMTLAKDMKASVTSRPYLLDGYENMEMSTQMLMFDAIQQGVQVEVLDEEDQFLRLTFQGQQHYVQKGNKTAKDNYVSQLIMNNKRVSKQVMRENGFVVPQEAVFDSLEKAKAFYPLVKGQAFVIKPKSTNFGIGISIFKHGASLEDYEEALTLAFQEDRSVLIEEYVAGTEYRFFVVDGQTTAVLLRVPANVQGDGQHTIKELVDLKNQDPLRGEGHRAPLEKIKIEANERLSLKDQGFNEDDIPAEGQTVYLRTTSNISTGGDSIDFTHRMHEDYKRLAGEIAQAMGAVVAGIDLIIPDYEQASSPEDPGYSCLEANWNPAMHMHMYVHQGPGQRVTLDILHLLFPELKLNHKHE